MIHEHTLICMNGYQNSTENMENTPKLIFTLMVFARILFWEIMLDTYKYGLRGHDCILHEISGTLFTYWFFILFGLETF